LSGVAGLAGERENSGCADSSDIQLNARYDRRLLGGAVVLEGKVLARAGEDWRGKLYREFQPAALQPVSVKFIPYSLWQNRGPSEMSVWVRAAVCEHAIADHDFGQIRRSARKIILRVMFAGARRTNAMAELRMGAIPDKQFNLVPAAFVIADSFAMGADRQQPPKS